MIARDNISQPRKGSIIFYSITITLLLALFLLGLLVGSSNMSMGESFLALFGNGASNAVRIVQRIRLPRVIACLVSGAGLALAGLLYQTSLGNIMASPGTLGVSNAAVLGANIAIIGFAGGFLSTGHNVANYGTSIPSLAISSVAFVFSLLSILVILGLSSIAKFESSSIILCGVAISAVWTSITSLLQYFATDVGLSAAVLWSFGDLGRADFEIDAIMGTVLIIAAIFAFIYRWKLNALTLGDEVAHSLGVKTTALRVACLVIASLLTSVIVSYLGIIGFVGIIAPHACRKLLGSNHKHLIPGSMILGALLILTADTLSRAIMKGTSIPIGTITSLLGGPFFLYLIFSFWRKSL